MLKRVMRWTGWGLLLSLGPLGCAAAFTAFQRGVPPSWSDVLGSGQGLLTCVAWVGASFTVLREAPPKWDGIRELIMGTSALMMLTLGAFYGFITANQLSGNTMTALQLSQVTISSGVMMVLAAGLSVSAVAIGTNQQSP
jgi:hypothetical protein